MRLELFLIKEKDGESVKSRLSTDYRNESYPKESEVTVLGFGGKIVASKKSGEDSLTINA